MKEKVSKLLDELLAENKKLFLIDLSVSARNEIFIVIDADHTLTISDCTGVSKFIRRALNDKESNYSIQVSSPGLDKPLRDVRQYKKNKNKKLKVTTFDNQIFEGILTEVDHKKIVLTFKQSKINPASKVKSIVEKQQEINYKEIKEAVVQIIF